MSFSARHPLSKSERRRLAERLKAALPAASELVECAKLVELARLRGLDADVVIIDGVPAVVVREDEVYLTLLAAYRLNVRLPTVIVNMGAVPHILNGADVMAPGIVDFEEFKVGGVVYVADVEKRRVFAVGAALVDSESLGAMKRGKVVRTLHYAGDKLWRALTAQP